MSKMSFITFLITSFFQEEASCRPSVAELAGKFKGAAPQQDATGQEAVRLMFKICILLEPLLPSTGRILLKNAKKKKIDIASCRCSWVVLVCLFF